MIANLSDQSGDLDASSTEWIVEQYANGLSESARIALRDAVIAALRIYVAEIAVTDRLVLVRLAEILHDTEAIRTSPDFVLDSLWSLATQLRRRGHDWEAAYLLGVIADDGPQRSLDSWTDTLAEFGPAARPACAVGVTRLGARHALEWLDLHLRTPEAFEQLCAIMLPALLERDVEGVRHYVSSLAGLGIRSRILSEAALFGIVLEPIALDEVSETVRFDVELAQILSGATGKRLGANFQKIVDNPGLSPLEAGVMWTPFDDLVSGVTDDHE
jgi:hypothetical protein